jgi:hypothetical protein
VAEELRDLVKTALLEGNGDELSLVFQLPYRLQAGFQIAPEDEEHLSLRARDAGGIAVKRAAGAGGVGVVIDRGMGREIVGSAGEMGEGLF